MSLLLIRHSHFWFEESNRPSRTTLRPIHFWTGAVDGQGCFHFLKEFIDVWRRHPVVTVGGEGDSWCEWKEEKKKNDISFHSTAVGDGHFGQADDFPSINKPLALLGRGLESSLAQLAQIIDPVRHGSIMELLPGDLLQFPG